MSRYDFGLSLWLSLVGSLAEMFLARSWGNLHIFRDTQGDARSN